MRVADACAVKTDLPLSGVFRCKTGANFSTGKNEFERENVLLCTHSPSLFFLLLLVVGSGAAWRCAAEFLRLCEENLSSRSALLDAARRKGQDFGNKKTRWCSGTKESIKSRFSTTLEFEHRCEPIVKPKPNRQIRSNTILNFFFRSSCSMILI